VTNATPPGWYPDPWKQAAQRFWDGAQWTHRVAGGGAPVERPRLRDDAPIYGPLIWIQALLPLLGGVIVWFIHIDYAQLSDFLQRTSDYAGTGPAPQLNPFAVFGPGYWVTLAFSPLFYAAQVVLAYFDQRRLERIGVVRPFHWAWTFLNGIVYVIGRSVIVRRVASPRGLAPVWVLIACYVVAMISSIVWVTSFMSQLVGQLSDFSAT
jgi:hypothetical protein